MILSRLARENMDWKLKSNGSQIRLFLLLFLTLLTLGCTRGALIVDPYWEAVVQEQGHSPKRIAQEMGLSYYVINGYTDEAIRENLEKFLATVPQKNWLIFSPWLREFIPEIKGNYRLGLLGMQGLPAANFPDVREVQVSRTVVLQEIIKRILKEDLRVAVLFNKREDLDIFTSKMEIGDNLFTVFVGSDVDLDRVKKNAETLLVLRDIEAMFILSEPYNFAVWQRLKNYTNKNTIVYSTGVSERRARFYLIDDNVHEQIRVILTGGDLLVEARL